ncbi:hypothetical protein F5Y06DRAFT_304878 [Hypoxylon sp. FL0890]|nr:hypothetical protein F5Y06DRAFT_304878 [Hypoxylon sp. FL0890]
MTAGLTVRLLHGDPTFVRYSGVKKLHQALRSKILDYRATPSSGLPPPKPTVVYFEPAPTYLYGRSAGKLDQAERRWFAPLQDYITYNHDYDETYRLNTAQRRILNSKLEIYSRRIHENEEMLDKLGHNVPEFSCKPEVMQRLDRELSTYFGPGQAVVWPVLDMRSERFARYTKSDIEMIMASGTMYFLKHYLDLKDTMYKPGSGVWIQSQHFKDEERQIADVHVNIEDDILSFGVSLNVESPIVGSRSINPWSRLKEADIQFDPVTSIAAELGDLGHVLGSRKKISMQEIMDGLVLDVCATLGFSSVKSVSHNAVVKGSSEFLR